MVSWPTGIVKNDLRKIYLTFTNTSHFNISQYDGNYNMFAFIIVKKHFCCIQFYTRLKQYSIPLNKSQLAEKHINLLYFASKFSNS